MPRHGYTRMFENMLDHPNIRIALNVSHRDVIRSRPFPDVVFTGPIDEYFDYCYGSLPYRSLEFRHETLEVSQRQPVAVVNYPNDYSYTRITEFKHLTGQNGARTSIVYEFPRSEGDPYYPIPQEKNASLYKRYAALAATQPHVYFVGRLATYRYYNMDQVVAQALTLCSKLSGMPRAALTYSRVPSASRVDVLPTGSMPIHNQFHKENQYHGNTQ
jgi:UDP-galactopyranose mutase